MNLRAQIKKGIETGIITYNEMTVKFDRYAIGGIVAIFSKSLRRSNIISLRFKMDIPVIRFIASINVL